MIASNNAFYNLNSLPSTQFLIRLIVFIDFLFLEISKYHILRYILCLFVEPLISYLLPHNITYSEGQTLRLSCMTEGFPLAKVEWLRNDETLPYENRISITGIIFL